MSVEDPRVVAYHARFGVRMAGGVASLEVSVPDWMPDEEIFQVLGGAAPTLGDLVDKLHSGGPCEGCDGVVCRIIKGREAAKMGGAKIYDSSLKLG